MRKLSLDGFNIRTFLLQQANRRGLNGGIDCPAVFDL